MFGRATVTLGIGPHSSKFVNFGENYSAKHLGCFGLVGPSNLVII